MRKPHWWPTPEEDIIQWRFLFWCVVTAFIVTPLVIWLVKA